MTDFFDVSEPKSNIAETRSSRPNATASRPSTSSDCIAEPEPHINIVSSEPNLKTKSSNVAEDETDGVKETIQHDMDVRCWGVISDQLRDYCCQIGSLEFQHLEADFSTSETCITGDKFKRRCCKSLFRREQLNGEIMKSSGCAIRLQPKNFTALFANFLRLILRKSCWHQLVMATGNMHHATWPGTNLLTNT